MNVENRLSRSCHAKNCPKPFQASSFPYVRIWSEIYLEKGGFTYNDVFIEMVACNTRKKIKARLTAWLLTQKVPISIFLKKEQVIQMICSLYNKLYCFINFPLPPEL